MHIKSAAVDINGSRKVIDILEPSISTVLEWQDGKKANGLINEPIRKTSNQHTNPRRPINGPSRKTSKDSNARDFAGIKTVIDGRNRLLACKQAGVDPVYKEFEGDVADFIYDENVTRRHLSVSQSAMAEALLYPTGRKKGNRYTGSRTTSTCGSRKVNHETSRQARKLVIEDAKDLIEQVVKGTMTVNAAHTALKNRRDGYDVNEDQLNELKENAPDLAELVKSGDSIDYVYRHYLERKSEQKIQVISI